MVHTFVAARRVVGALFLLSTFAAAVNAQDVLPQFGEAYHRAAFAEALTIDGKLDEVSWQTAEVITIAEAEGWPGKIRILHDRENLYLAAVMSSKNPSRIITRYNKHGDRTWRDDALEVYVDGKHDQRGYRQVCINAAGFACITGRGIDNYRAVNGGAFKTIINSDNWTLEAAIPLAELEARHDRGESMPIAMARHVMESPQAKWIGWGKPRSIKANPLLVLANDDNALAFASRYRQLASELIRRIDEAEKVAAKYQFDDKTTQLIERALAGRKSIGEAIGPNGLLSKLSFDAMEDLAAFDERLVAAYASAKDLKATLLFAPFFDASNNASPTKLAVTADDDVSIGVNLLRNGDFELGREAWAIYGRRDEQGTAEIVTVDHADPPRQNKAVLITKAQPLPGPPGLHQECDRIQAGAAYQLSLSIKTENLDWPDHSRMAAALQVFFRNSTTGKTIKVMTHSLPTGTHDWSRMQVKFVPPDGADVIQVTLMSHGITGRLYVDDFELTRLADDVGAWPSRRRDGEWKNTIARDVPTPHVPWAVPLQGGALRTGMVVQRSGAREAAELAQRLHIDFDAVTAYHPTALGLPDEKAEDIGTSLTEKKAELAAMLGKQFDLFVIGNLQWGMLDEDVRRELIRRVHDDGMGLVLTFQQDQPLPYEWQRLQDRRLAEPPAAIVANLPLDDMRFGYEQSWNPVEQAETRRGPDTTSDLVHAMPLGKGRVVHLRYTYPDYLMWRGVEKSYGPYGGSALTPWIMYDGSNLHRYEYHMMLLARACLWAAHREGDALPTGATIEPISAGKPAVVQMPVSLPTLGKSELHYTIRDADHGVVMAEGVGLNVTTPALPAGTYQIEYRIVLDGNVIGFGAPTLHVRGEAAVNDLRVTYADLNVDSMTVHAAVQNAESAAIELTDTLGRVIFHHRATVEGLAAGVTLDRLQPLTPLHRLDVTALDASGTPQARARQEVFIPGAPRPDYLLGPYTSNSGYLPALWCHLRAARDFGHNAQYEIGRWRNQFWPAMSSANRVGMQHIAGFQTLYKARPWQKQYRDRHLSWVERDARNMAERGLMPLGIAMGDESNLNWGYKEVGLDDEAKESLRQWLRDHVGDLAAVNKRWGTQFAAWDQVEPIVLEEAHAAGQYVRWYDGWKHLTDRFTDILRDSAQRIHQHLPGAHVGFEDPIDIGVCVGYDIPKMFDYVTFYGAYQRYGHWLTMRSFAKPDAIMLSVSHARMPDPEGRQGRWQLWSGLFHGFQGHLYHRLEGTDDYPAMGYDLSIRKRWITDKPIATQQQAEQVDRYDVEFVSFSDEAIRLNAGPARLVLSAQREPEPVAILHNTASVYAWCLVHTADGTDPNRDRGYSSNLDAPFVVEHLLNDAHTTYRMIGERDMLASPDWAQQRSIKVIVLPAVMAMSSQAADRIRAFVRDGGIVIAGVRPAVFDDICQPLEKGQLDDVFGVRSGMARPVALRTGSATVDPLDAVPYVEYDAAVALAGGVARGKVDGDGTPLLIEHAFGKGRAYLWNIRPRYTNDGTPLRDVVDSWGRMMPQAVGNEPLPAMGHPALLAALREALGRANVRGPVTFTGDSDALMAVESWAFRRGKTRLIGLSRHNYPLHTDVKSVELAFDSSAFVYDVTRGKSLGRVASASIPLDWGDAALLACLPYEVGGVNATAIMSPEGVSLVARVKGATPDAYHVLNIRVFGPDGIERTEHHCNVIADGGVARVVLPIALNATSGTWRIAVRDVISGAVAETPVEIAR